jgi:hypothetical protein
MCRASAAAPAVSRGGVVVAAILLFVAGGLTVRRRTRA